MHSIYELAYAKAFEQLRRRETGASSRPRPRSTREVANAVVPLLEKYGPMTTGALRSHLGYPSVTWHRYSTKLVHAGIVYRSDGAVWCLPGQVPPDSASVTILRSLQDGPKTREELGLTKTLFTKYANRLIESGQVVRVRIGRKHGLKLV